MKRFLLIALTVIATLVSACGPPLDVVVVELGGDGEFPWRLIETTLGYEHYEISIPDRRFDGASDQDWYRLVDVPPYSRFSPEAPGCVPRLEVVYDAEQPFDLHITTVVSEDLHPITRQRSFHDERLVGELPVEVTPAQPLSMRFTLTSGAPVPDYDLTLRFIKPVAVGARACTLFTPPL
jgi:hypothetical protein